MIRLGSCSLWQNLSYCSMDPIHEIVPVNGRRWWFAFSLILQLEETEQDEVETHYQNILSAMDWIQFAIGNVLRASSKVWTGVNTANWIETNKSRTSVWTSIWLGNNNKRNYIDRHVSVSIDRLSLTLSTFGSQITSPHSYALDLFTISNRFVVCRRRRSRLGLHTCSINGTPCLCGWQPEQLLRCQIQSGQFRFRPVGAYPFQICVVRFFDATVVRDIFALCIDAIQLRNLRIFILLLNVVQIEFVLGLYLSLHCSSIAFRVVWLLSNE